MYIPTFDNSNDRKIEYWSSAPLVIDFDKNPKKFQLPEKESEFRLSYKSKQMLPPKLIAAYLLQLKKSK